MSKLAEYLRTLEAFDLIERDEVDKHLEYLFKHVFTQESVYGSLLRADRRELHQQVGEALEAEYGEAVDEYCLLLAHHFEKSGDGRRALRYLRRAAERAAGSYANQEAKELYDRALILVEEEGERWEVLAGREQVLDRLGQREQQAADLQEMERLAAALNDPVRLARSQMRRAAYFDKTSQYQAAAEAAEMGLAVARRSGQKRLEAQALNLLALAAWRRFDYPAVQAWANQALDALRMVGDPAVRTTSLLHLGRAGYRLGQYDGALETIQAARELAQASDDRHSEAVAHLILGWIYQRLGQYGAAEEQFGLTLTKRQAIGDRHGEAVALSHLGWVAYDREQYGVGREQCQAALLISRGIGDRENEAYALSGLGLAAEGEGRTAEAREFYEQALGLHRAIGAETLVMFDLSRLAWLALAEGKVAEAYQLAQAVMTWTAEHGAERFWDPWLIHTINVQVLRAAGREEEAGRVLAEAYDLLQRRAGRISDVGLRGSFLKNVAVNRWIVEEMRKSGERGA
jgi:tetratricopeptide (TPR) repeat protein